MPEDMQSKDEKPRVNTGHLPVALDVLSRMSPKALGMKLLEWHAGGGSGVYSVGSTLMAGKAPDPLQLKIAIQELLKSWPEMTEGDRIETHNLAMALKNRFMQGFESQADNSKPSKQAMNENPTLHFKPSFTGECDRCHKMAPLWRDENEPGEFEYCKNCWDKIVPIQKDPNMNPIQPEELKSMAAWVLKNCKFAQVGQPAMQQPGQQAKPYMQPRILPPQEIEGIISMLIQKFQRIAKQDADPTANYNAVKKQITMGLQSALAQKGAVSQINEDMINQIMRGIGVMPPAQGPGPSPVAPANQAAPTRRPTRMPFE